MQFNTILVIKSIQLNTQQSTHLTDNWITNWIKNLISSSLQIIEPKQRKNHTYLFKERKHSSLVYWNITNEVRRCHKFKCPSRKKLVKREKLMNLGIDYMTIRKLSWWICININGQTRVKKTKIKQKMVKAKYTMA